MHGVSGPVEVGQGDVQLTPVRLRTCHLWLTAAVAAIAAIAAVAPPRASATRLAVGVPASADRAVPILTYHVIGASNVHVRFAALRVSRRAFASHVAALQRAGYQAVTLQQVWSAWHAGGALPRRPVVFSFDDGYVGQPRDALPILRAAGWPGVLNLELSSLASMGGSAAVRRLVRAGWEIDSHTLTHPDLTRLTPTQLRRELIDSRARIQRLFGVPANFLCYPFGRFDASVTAAARDAGYLGATTIKTGYAQPTSDPFKLPRIQVTRGNSAGRLLARLRSLRPG